MLRWRRFKLTLLHKELMLVLVPLCCVQVALAVLLVQSGQLEKTVREAAIAKRAIGLLHKTAVSFLEYYLSLDPFPPPVAHSVSQQLASSGASIKACRSTGQFMQEQGLCLDTRDEILPVFDNMICRDIEPGNDLAIQRLVVASFPCAQGFRDLCQGRVTSEMRDCRDALSKSLMQMAPSLKRAQEKLRAGVSENREAQRSLRQAQRQEIIIAIGTVIFFSVCMGVFLVKRILDRLCVVAGNINRLARGEGLSVPLSGNDEIVRLDDSFHELFGALVAARSAEEAVARRLSDSQVRHRSMFSNLPVGLLSTDSQARITDANPSACRLLEGDPPDLVGKPLASFLIDSPFADGALAKYCTADSRRELMIKGVRGHEFPADVVVSESPDSFGAGYLVSMQDASSRVSAETGKRQLYAMIVHDLRSPLMSIQTSLELVAEGAVGTLSGNDAGAISEARQLTTDTIGCINSLLDFEKLRSGRFELTYRTVSIDYILEQANEKAIAAFPERSRIKLPETNMIIQVDPERLVQGVLAVLKHALAMSAPDKAPTLSVEADGCNVELKICYENLGSAYDVAEEAFSASRATEPVAAQQHIGRFLELAVARGLIQLHGGSTGFSAMAAGGSCLRIRLRCEPEEHSQEEMSVC
jgi:PAS domain S-box-containing protein